MKTLKNNSETTFKSKVLKAGTFCFLMICFSLQAMADESLEEAKANAARNELLSYIAMGLGIAIVIFIAVTTALKGRKEDNLNSGNTGSVSHRPFIHKHDHHHGRRGAPVRRRR